MDNANVSGVAQRLMTVAGGLLLVLWLASMALADDRLCSAVPLCLGLSLVLLLAVAAMVLGARPARPTLTCMLGLAAGLYFAIRCVAGDCLSEIWRELPLLLGAFVFYGAGFCSAQRSGGKALVLALVLGVVANVVFFFLMRHPAVPLEVSGRPAMTMAGANSRGMALFVYKNFAGMFLMLAGAVLLFRSLWAGWNGWAGVASVAVGIAGVICSCLCDTRAVVGLAPLLAVGGWLLWVIVRLYDGRGVGVGAALTGVALFAGGAVALGDLMIGGTLLGKILSVDTHMRADVWELIYDVLPQTPWCGYGAGAVQWLLVPFFASFVTPNYAHNEYLQAWVDYGAVGIGLIAVVLLMHLIAGFCSLASEDTGSERRSLVAACLLLLSSLAACAFFDFVWHSFALAGLTAFCCGVLAAPVPSRRESLFSRRNWAPGCGPALRPVRFMGKNLAAVTCVFCVVWAGVCGWFGWHLLPAWKSQWTYNALFHAHVPDEQRVEFLEKVMPSYPDPGLVNHYISLRPPPERKDNVQRLENMFRLALQSNPRQLFIVMRLAEVLGRQGRHEEAEQLLRERYAPGGQPSTGFVNWPRPYGMNLLAWGRQRMMEGDYAAALSMLEFALNLHGHSGGFHSTGASSAELLARVNEEADAFVAARRVDVDMLRTIGVEKDDSWQQPMRPGGPAALYQRWGNLPYEGKFAEPYSSSPPLNKQKK